MTHKFNLSGYLASLGRNAAAFLLYAAVPPLANAATNVTVSVTVLETPSCVINGNRIIELDFGEILTVSVNGSNYMKNLDYTLDCPGIKSNALRMSLQGTATSFDPSALQTNVSGFGLALRANGQPVAINSWLKFTYPDKPLLQAVPVKKTGQKLPGGAFTAGATLLVAYQ
jgi:type 1 fimbria pilin